MRRMSKLLAVAGVEGDVDRLSSVLEAERRSVDAVALVGALAAPWGPKGIYQDVFRLLGESGKPAFWVPGVSDAQVHDYLTEAFDLEIVFPSLHVVHGTFATAPGDLVFAGLGGEIVDDAETAQAEEALLCYSGWEAEYRLRMLSEFDEYPLVLLFATPPAHNGLGESGSRVVAELIERFSPRVAIVGGRDPKHGVLGRSLIVSPGRLVDGCYAVVDLDSGTVEQSQLPDRIAVAAAPTQSSPDAASPITATQRSRLDASWRGPISRSESRKPDKRTQQGGSAMTAIPIEPRKELAYRTSNGIEVTLFWEKPTTRVAVRVSDMQLGESFEFEVEGANALDAFHHPYAYAASQGVKSSVDSIDALLAYSCPSPSSTLLI